MTPQAEIFRDLLAALAEHADTLQRTAQQLHKGTASDVIVAQFAGTDAAPVLRDAAQSTRRWDQHIRNALAASDGLSAMANFGSVISSVDRAMTESLSTVTWGNGGIGRLSTVLDPIYTRAIPLFDLDADPPTTAKMDAFSHWLATSPHPWKA